MKVYFSTSILLSLFAYVSCDDGSAGGLHTATFSGEIRITSEQFSDDLNNAESTKRSSLNDSFVDATTKELGTHLNSTNVGYETIRVSVLNFRRGSVAVSFLVTVEETTMNTNDLGTAIQVITQDMQLGTFTVDEAQDVDECKMALDNCNDLATCLNSFGGYKCKCLPEYFDKNGDGSVCVTPVNVTCSPSNIKVSVFKDYLTHLSIGENDLHLNNETCGATSNDTSERYDIFDDMSTCGNSVKNNGSHVSYHNILSNVPRKTDIVVTGNNISIPFSCSYPTNLTKSVSFEGGVPSIGITVEPGNGLFDVDFGLHKDALFEEIEEKRKFKTTDTLHLQAMLKSGDSSLRLVFDKCWATPSNNLNDPTTYRIISNGCHNSKLPSGAVTILTNGEAEYARVSIKVFTFIDESTTYIHCNLAICSSSQDSCKPTCLAPIRRRRSLFSSVSLTRVRRESAGGMQEKSLGPLYRIGVDQQSSDNRFWAVTIILIVVISLLLAIVGFIIMRRFRRSSKEPVVALSIRQLDDDDVGFHARNDLTYCDSD